MGSIIKYKPTTPGRRFMTTLDRSDITKDKPEKSLTTIKKKHSGRNNTGKLTVRHQAGGHKRRLREIDFARRDRDGVDAKIAAIEYDPNRSARIALLHYTDGVKRYILASKGMKVGDLIQNGEKIDINEGNCLPLSDIPLGSFIHNVELHPGRGGALARSAGMYAQIVAKEGNYAHVRLPSGEVRLIHQKCRATMGQVGNEEHSLVCLGKAGRSRWMGIKPTVRGTVMNPCDHPHGGGEGKNKTAGRHPVSPWGVLAKGGKTRSKKKSNKAIITSRKKKRKR